MTESFRKKVKGHDAEGARLAILDAAEEVFSEHGFDGARIDEIARCSGYNKSLIFQYYGDKLSLYTEVVRRIDKEFDRISNTIFPMLYSEEIIVSPDKFTSTLEAMLIDYFDRIVKYPHFIRIILWEMAENWETFSKIRSQKDVNDMHILNPALFKIQDAGYLRPNLPPMVQFALVLHMCLYVLSILPLYQMLMPDEDLTSNEALARVRQFFIDFALHGLVVDPAQGKPPQKG